MSTYNITYDWEDDERFFQNDTLSFPFIVNDVNISTWLIRAQFTDQDGNYVKLATASITGGSDAEINITDGANGKFTVTVAKDLTDCFAHRCFLEVERELASGVIQTIVKKEIYLEFEDIDWTTK